MTTIETAEGTYEISLGPNGHVTDSSFTCRWCGQTLQNVIGTTKTGLHLFGCSNRPDDAQSALTEFR